MPLLTIKKTQKLVLRAALTPLVFIALAPLSKAEDEAALVLPPMTVFGTKNSDNSYTQTSAIAWQDANDLTISVEDDGSYTTKATTKSYSLKTLLVSLGRPRVNIDFAYAANSISMTAAGKMTLSTLLEAFGYLDSDVVLEVTPTFNDRTRGGNQLMQRRLDALRRVLERNTQVSIKVKSPKIVTLDSATDKRSTTWRVQIRRMQLK